MSAEEQRVQEAVRRHARNSAFAEAEKAISFMLSDPGVQEARARVEAAETQPGMELCARLQPRFSTTRWRRSQWRDQRCTRGHRRRGRPGPAC